MTRKTLVAVLLIGVALGYLGFGLQISQIEFDLYVDQGETYTFSFLVRNDSERSQTVTIYLGDWDRDVDGTNRFYPVGTIERTLSPWLLVEPARLNLPPGEAQEITATLAVPSREEASLDGTYWGIIFVQGEPRPVEQGGTTVMAIERFGVKVYATIAGTEAPSGVVRAVEATPSDEGVEVRVVYENTGNVKQRVQGSLEVIDRTGTLISEVPIDAFPILPGAQRVVVLTLAPLDRGIYQLRAVLDYGGDVLVAGVTVLRVR